MLKIKRGDILLIIVLVVLGSAWLLLRQVLESRETVEPRVNSYKNVTEG
jgi:hypothetical protein